MTTLAALPPVIDSTMLVTWRSCPRKFYLSFCENLAPSGQSVHLLFGGALAKGLEVARKLFYTQDVPSPQAQAAGICAALQYYGDFVPSEKNSAKSWEGLLLAMDGYFRQWPLGHDSVKPHAGGVEVNFALPIPGAFRPDGSPWIYGGRYDMLAEIDGILHIEDDKTTGGSFSFSWSEQWHLRNQFLGYIWAAQQHGLPVERCLVRGISILKTKVDFAQAIAHYPKHMIDRWLQQTVRDLNRISTQWTEGYFDFNLGDTCTAFGGCAFNSPCSTTVPEEWYSMFAKRNWDPVAQNPEKLIEAA